MLISFPQCASHVVDEQHTPFHYLPSVVTLLFAVSVSCESHLCKTGFLLTPMQTRSSCPGFYSEWVVLCRSGGNFVLLQPFHLLDLGLSILHTKTQNAVKFIILQLSLLILTKLSFPFPHSLVKEQHFICIYSLVMQCHLSVKIWLHCELFSSFLFPAQLEMSPSQSFWDGVKRGEREKKKSGKENSCSR